NHVPNHGHNHVHHHQMPTLYDGSGAPRPTEPSYAELLILSEKIQEYEMLISGGVTSGPGSVTGAGHRQGCPSVASNASLNRTATLVGNHVPFGGNPLAASNGYGCKGEFLVILTGLILNRNCSKLRTE